MKLAFYKGKSITSRLIRWKTRGEYSHVAVIFDDGRVLEAWQGTNSVRWIKSLSDGHTPGTEVVIFDIDAPVNEEAALKFAESQIDKPYGYRTILKFLTNTSGDNKDAWICSEIALAICIAGGAPLLARVDAYKISPVTLSWSPLLKFNSTVVTENANASK
jgi:uncharacterized protein YycO